MPETDRPGSARRASAADASSRHAGEPRVPGAAKPPAPLRLPDDGVLPRLVRAYVLLGTFAHDFMATKVFGNINLGMILGLGQFVTTFVITGLYVRFANRELDPRSAAIRDELEGPRK